VLLVTSIHLVLQSCSQCLQQLRTGRCIEAAAAGCTVVLHAMANRAGVAAASVRMQAELQPPIYIPTPNPEAETSSYCSAGSTLSMTVGEPPSLACWLSARPSGKHLHAQLTCNG
jgi:hypothetical protein